MYGKSKCYCDENHVLSSPGTNKYLRSSLYLKKAVTSMVKLLPRRTLYDEIFYKTHKIINTFIPTSHHSRFYNHTKILSNRLYNLPSLESGVEFTFHQCMHIRMSAIVPCFCCCAKSIRPANPNKYL